MMLYNLSFFCPPPPTIPLLFSWALFNATRKLQGFDSIARKPMDGNKLGEMYGKSNRTEGEEYFYLFFIHFY